MIELKKIGNLWGYDGGNYAGNVYDKEGISPVIHTPSGGLTQPMIIEETEPISTNGTDISGTIRATYYKNGERNTEENVMRRLGYEGVVEPLSCASRGRNPDNPSDRTAGIPTEQRLEVNDTGVANCLTSVFKDSMVLEPTINTEMDSEVIKTTEKTETGYRIRKLTPRECWRLMGFCDEDFEKAEAMNSNTKLFMQAGNSIVVNVLMAIFGMMFVGRENAYKSAWNV